MGWDKKEGVARRGSQCPTFSILRDVREEGELHFTDWIESPSAGMESDSKSRGIMVGWGKANPFLHFALTHSG